MNPFFLLVSIKPAGASSAECIQPEELFENLGQSLWFSGYPCQTKLLIQSPLPGSIFRHLLARPQSLRGALILYLVGMEG